MSVLSEMYGNDRDVLSTVDVKLVKNFTDI